MKVLDHGFVELVSKTGHPGLAIVNAARCSFGASSDSMEERDRKLVRFLLGNGHTSPFRHAFFTFHVKAPLFVFRQWWKYQVGSTWREYEVEGWEAGPNETELRISAIDIQIDTDQGCSWNELSGRYKVMEPEFYVPEEARQASGRSKQASEVWNDDHKRAFMQARMRWSYKRAVEDYEAMLDAGLAKELARIVLPPAIYSEAYWTVSLQAVLHFLDQRLKDDAQFEIREYAQGILELVRPDLAEMGVEQ